MPIRAFVTGGTGFVGANLVRSLLQEGYAVRALVRPTSRLDNLQGLDVEIVKGDLNDPLSPQMEGCQVLFHTAAHYSLWQADREALYHHNVLGTRNVLTAARKAGIERTVYTSSVAAIGVGKPGTIVDETHQSPLDKLVGHYKKSKFLAEQTAKEAVQAGQDIVIVNPSTPIGPWDIKPTPTGGDLILRFLRRQMPAYLDTGLNLIDVRDVARGHILALERGKTGDRYILGHQNLTLKALLDQLAQITGLKAPQRTVPTWLPLSVAWIDERILAPLGKPPSVPLDGVRMAHQFMYYDASKAVRELGLPQTSLTTALQDAVNWFVSQKYVGASNIAPHPPTK